MDYPVDLERKSIPNAGSHLRCDRLAGLRHDLVVGGTTAAAGYVG